MKVMCSGELYSSPIDTSTCLECALYNGNPPCGYSYPLLKAMFAGDGKEYRQTEIHVSDLFTCLRKAYLDKTEPEPQYVHMMFYMTVGTAVHEFVERALEGDENIAVEMDVENKDVKGRIDLYFKKEKTLFDLKTSRWISASKVPHGNHEKQVNIYSALLKGSGREVDKIFLQYIDVSGPTKCKRCFTHPTMMMIDGYITCPSCGSIDEDAHLGAVIVPVEIMDNEETLKDIEQRALRLKDAMEKKSMPEAETGWICRYCLQTQKCDEGQYFLNGKGRR